MLFTHQNCDEAIPIINAELTTVSSWLLSNRLSVNLTKTHYVLFHGIKKRITNPLLPVLINNQPISRECQTTVLGFTLHESLSWFPHISKVSAKLCRVV